MIMNQPSGGLMEGERKKLCLKEREALSPQTLRATGMQLSNYHNQSTKPVMHKCEN